MPSVTETSTAALGKQGETIFFLAFRGATGRFAFDPRSLGKESESERLSPL